MSQTVIEYIEIHLNENKTVTSDDYLYQIRGPQRLSLYVILPLTAVNFVIGVTGFVGNIIVCIVILRHPSLHTTTNYYLFNLAVSDMMLLLFGKYLYGQIQSLAKCNDHFKHGIKIYSLDIMIINDKPILPEDVYIIY